MTTPTNNNNASRPMWAKTLLDDFHPSRFLKVTDLLNRWKIQQITVTISRVTQEETTPNLKDIDPETKKPRRVWQPAFYFLTKNGSEWPSAYLLSAKVDIEALKTATNAQTAEELPQKRVTIKVSEHRGQAVLRIDPTPPAPAHTPTPPTPAPATAHTPTPPTPAPTPAPAHSPTPPKPPTPDEL